MVDSTLGTIDAHRQRPLTVRFDWGSYGGRTISEGADLVVVIDVLSFTTTLSLAIDGGSRVFPVRWGDTSAATFARRHNAVLAAGRSDQTEGQISLSPASLRRTASPARLVLPSPNGATISCDLATVADTVIGASLRNADAVAAWSADRLRPDATVAVVAAGERWPDGSLRPAVEDLWGAGAVIQGLVERGWAGLSAEATVAQLAWASLTGSLTEALLSCASGGELAAMGFREDVLIAGELNASRSVPVLRGGAYTHAEPDHQARPSEG
jgi:2-phosphosulfolactate phosphatase